MCHIKLQLRLQLTRFELWVYAQPRRDPIAIRTFDNRPIDS